LAFWAWLILLNAIIPFPANDIISFLFMAKLYPILFLWFLLFYYIIVVLGIHCDISKRVHREPCRRQK
jgi:hypothetical protein